MYLRVHLSGQPVADPTAQGEQWAHALRAWLTQTVSLATLKYSSPLRCHRSSEQEARYTTYALRLQPADCVMSSIWVTVPYTLQRPGWYSKVLLLRGCTVRTYSALVHSVVLPSLRAGSTGTLCSPTCSYYYVVVPRVAWSTCTPDACDRLQVCRLPSSVLVSSWWRTYSTALRRGDGVAVVAPRYISRAHWRASTALHHRVLSRLLTM